VTGSLPWLPVRDESPSGGMPGVTSVCKEILAASGIAEWAGVHDKTKQAWSSCLTCAASCTSLSVSASFL